ncbi:MAG TPA: ATP-binding protein, partial [Opitutaceae bacterium]|nr:ATP-binding protein [Opitutaceae bacterium]
MPSNGETFSGLLHAELQALHQAGQTRTFEAGAVIFSAGDPGDGFYIVESGRVQIIATFGGNEPLTLATITAGDFFGEMAVLDDAPRSATAKAETETRATFLSRETLLDLLDRRPRLALNLIREFSSRMRALNRKYVNEIIQAERLAVIGRFAATIVHDFKNPLTIIGLAAELACSDDTAPPMRVKAQTKIVRQVERMTNMLQELIEFTKPTGHRPTLRGVNFARYMKPLAEEIRQEIADRGVKLMLQMPPPEIEVRLDPPRLSRLFYNLLNNAVEAMPDGGRIFLRFTVNPDELQVDIEDTGPGIAPAVAPTLFRPFATHGKPHGTGLGLTICKKIAEDHGGRIWATSTPGKGA